MKPDIKKLETFKDLAKAADNCSRPERLIKEKGTHKVNKKYKP